MYTYTYTVNVPAVYVSVWNRLECATFLEAFFYCAFNVVERVMHIYLNLVKINCFLYVYPYHLIKFQSLNAPSCQHFWTGLLFMYIVLCNIQYYFPFFIEKLYFPIVLLDPFPSKALFLKKITQDFNDTSYTLFVKILYNFPSVFL